MLVAGRAGAVAVRVDGVHLRPMAPGFHDEGPQVDIGAENVRAPRQDQLRMPKLLRLRSVTHAQRLRQACGAGRRANGAVEPRGAQPVKETAIRSDEKS